MMGGEFFQSGRYAGAFRRRVFREHLGLLERADGEALVKDPICPEFYHDCWQATADQNTQIYEQASLVKYCKPLNVSTYI
jgi:hypothetical protein